MITVALGLLADPRVGLPVVLFAVGVVLWTSGRPDAEPVRRRREPTERAPDADPVSRTYVAIRRGAYSEILDSAYDRLDRAVDARAGCRLGKLPWSTRAAKAKGLEDPRGLRRSRDALNSLIVWSLALETGNPLRWDFWRSQESSRAKFHTRLAEHLTEVDRHLTQLGSTP